MVCGSTCSLILIYEDQIISISLGDSKSIIAKRNEKGLTPVNLSIEHNTKNKKEVQRVLKKGGIVQPTTNKNGKFLGPDRVWNKELTYPGLQITRGFGDLCGRDCGISGQPGMILGFYNF
jgi:serine/threonine protein phosphatase PrpC